MKIYFGTTPRIKDKYPAIISDIYRLIEKNGYKHTSSWVKKATVEKFSNLSEKELSEHHLATEAAIKAADICVFEASSRSLSIGYLVNLALGSGKVVVILSQNPESLSLFRGIKSEALLTVVYTANDLEKKLREVLDRASGKTDVRFNFFITPKLLMYLDWVSSKRRIPRSVFLRDLIEKEMKKDKEFKS